MCKLIWKDDICKIGYIDKDASLTYVRYIVVANAALKLMKNPKYNTGQKAQAELIRQGVVLKPPNPDTRYLGELLYILTQIGWSYMRKQNEILRPIFIDLLKEEPILSASDIAEKFGLEGLKGKRLIESMLSRIFGKHVQNRDSIVQIREFVRNSL